MLSGLAQSFHDMWKRSGRTGMGTSAIRIALLFASITIILTLLLTPEAARQSRQAIFDPGIDKLVTSSIHARNSIYVERRSVLQPTPDSVCIISRDGSKRGQC